MRNALVCSGNEELTMFTEQQINQASVRKCAGSTLLPVTTLVVWLGCLVVGGLGIALPYQHPQAVKTTEVTQAELLNVDLANDLPAETQMASAATAVSTLPAPSPISPLLTVAAPAFALPVALTVNQAIVSQTNNFASTAAPSVQPLTFGVGDGRQPAPVYPREAVRAGQEGKVAVRFCVAESGRVVTAEAAKPSPWPLLNDEAVRTVRKRWHFHQGPPRVYEVTIRFELNKERNES